MNSVGVKTNGKGNIRVGKPGTIRCFNCGNGGHKANDKGSHQEENSAGSVIVRAISRFCVKLN